MPLWKPSGPDEDTRRSHGDLPPVALPVHRYEDALLSERVLAQQGIRNEDGGVQTYRAGDFFETDRGEFFNLEGVPVVSKTEGAHYETVEAVDAGLSAQRILLVAESLPDDAAPPILLSTEDAFTPDPTVRLEAEAEITYTTTPESGLEDPQGGDVAYAATADIPGSISTSTTTVSDGEQEEEVVREPPV